MRDLEHPEGRDAGGKAGEPHQREADDDRIRGADGGGERQRRDVSDCRVAKEAGEVRHDRRLLARRHRKDPRRPRADRDEADVPEGQDP